MVDGVGAPALGEVSLMVDVCLLSCGTVCMQTFHLEDGLAGDGTSIPGCPRVWKKVGMQRLVVSMLGASTRDIVVRLLFDCVPGWNFHLSRAYKSPRMM